ncbi:MAG: family 43 glycosylhydrolase [Bacteroidales bacterium]|nr:family 43 glycosylhydrolase [Bacteroidales bacterium]
MILLFLVACRGEEHCYKPVTPPDSEEPQTETVTKSGTLVRTSAADPCIVFHEGEFYMTMTGSANIALVHDKSLANLTSKAHPNSKNLAYRSTEDPSVEEIFGEGAVINGTWSPEIHYFSEEECPGNSGWYMVFSLRMKYEEDGRTSSKYLCNVVLKSLGGTPAGPWGHPLTGEPGHTQRLLAADGTPADAKAGLSFLRIPSGKYKGLYAMWIDSVGRGEGYGNFYQRLRIARFLTPWQIGSDAHTITVPTQDWERKGASSILPMVVEGGTAVYGDHGEIYLTYCGSGYWSDYGQGQLTLLREGDDYADPLMETSWIKYADNPILSSVKSDDLRGAGHVFLFRDAAGSRFIVYHAYPYVNGEKQEGRNAYIEPYSIDYTAVSPTSPQGLLKFGLLGTGVTAPTGSEIEFHMITGL